MRTCFYKDFNLHMVVAATAKGEIGYQKTIPWKLKGDLKYFRDVTMGSTVIMGRKTAESIIKINVAKGLPSMGHPGASILADRQTIVVSSPLKRFNGSTGNWGTDWLASSFVEALWMATNRNPGTGIPKDVMVVGGVELYNQAMMLPCSLHLTVPNVPLVYNGLFDAVIPNFNLKARGFIPNGSKAFIEPHFEIAESGVSVLTHHREWHHNFDEPRALANKIVMSDAIETYRV